MGHYKSNVRDLEFNLFEVLALEKALATGEFGDLDGESVRQMLAEASKLAEGPVAESFAETDRRPPTFDPDTHAVTIPEPFKQSLNAWRQGEWFRIGLDEGLDGVPAPAMLAWAINELPLGRQSAGVPLHGGPDHGGHPYHIGNEQQRHWHRLRSNAIGPPPWCSPNPTPDRTSVRAAQRRSSRPTAPGTSTASSGSSPTATPTTCSRTSCTWCSRDPRVRDREPRG